MALVVEDGTGLADADAFCSVDFANTYHADRGNAAWQGLTEPKEQAIRRATAYLSDSMPWQGQRTKTLTQSLSWPRAWVTGRDGVAVKSDIVPIEVQRATAEYALRELTTPGSLAPDYVASGRVKSERVGDLAVEYDLTRTDAGSARTQVLVAQDMIAHLLRAGAGNHLVGTSVRV